MAIGLPKDYDNDPQAKKDVVDPSGEPHSVKGGMKKWQIFLYGKNRFEKDHNFQTMNGIGQLLVQCIESFPASYEEYQRGKDGFKESLRAHMRGIKRLLEHKPRMKAFLHKSMFNSYEVKYLTVKHDGVYHVFQQDEVIEVFGENLEVHNSVAKAKGQFPEQKVLFKYKGLNLGELEMRNDSPVHYREIRFNMIKPKVMGLLFEKIPHTGDYSDQVKVYGNAMKKFGKWDR